MTVQIRAFTRDDWLNAWLKEQGMNIEVKDIKIVHNGASITGYVVIYNDLRLFRED